MIAGLLLVCIVLTLIFFPTKEKNVLSSLPNLQTAIDNIAVSVGQQDYDTYIASHEGMPLIASSVQCKDHVTIKEGESHTFRVNTSSCMASIRIKYTITAVNDSSASCSVKINGKLPFKEAAEMTLNRDWMSGESDSDDRGNQYTVPLDEGKADKSAMLSDTSGFHTEPFAFAFKNGSNKITVSANRGNIVIKELSLFAYEEAKPYSEVCTTYPEGAVQNTITVEGESPYIRSSASIAEQCDRTSPLSTPVFSGLQVWNTIGGTGWGTVGQTVTWKFHVEQTGCYTLSFRYKNNFTSGFSTYRRLYLDGKIPFAEMESVKFPYDVGWQQMRLADDDNHPYLYYLKEGDHTLTLEVTLGQQALALNLARKSLNRLNEAYRKIVMVTGATPDTYRDYQIEKKLPDVLEILKEQKAALQQLSDWLNIENGGKGEGTAKVDEIVRQISDFIRYPESIPQSLSTFSGDLTGLSDWIQSSTAQPLTIDKFQLVPLQAKVGRAEASFFKKLSFNTLLYFKSFADDYGVIGNIYDKDSAIDVWLTLGRDQYQILKEQTDNYFTAEKNIGVNLKLVSGGLLNATIAGIAPDVYLFSDEGTPVNFASRGALTDLTVFSDFEEVKKRFASQAFVPFSYDGGVYALPISQSFEVMFARDDILEEIGLSVPRTWEDVYNCLTILQQNNMEFAFPGAGGTEGLALLLFRKQTSLYKNNGKSVAFDTENAISTFEEWTRLYSQYSLLQSYSFVNRFRTGDMPIGIADFSTFNTLEVSAPEISGLWSMHPVPGTVQEDGSLKNITVSHASSAIILKSTKHAQEAWEYIKWFTSAEEQYRYATAIENRQGISGRVATANLDAFNRLGWTADTLKTLNFQRETAYAIEQVPGGYFLSRHINNIFRKVINQDANVRETVLEYVNTINEEITKKRKEFGLEVDAS